jgi:hypothetical protein
MIDPKKLTEFRKQRPSTVLALALDGSQLDGVVVRRVNGSVQLLQSFNATLSLDPLTADAELVGREIRNHLNAANIRERNCIVCVPLKWAMTAQVEIPELSEADIPGFLQIEAERGFHSDPDTLYFAASRYSLAAKPQATLVGIPRGHVERLEKALLAARLKPLSLSLGIAALQPPGAETSSCVLTLVVGDSNVGLQITCGGGIAALRTLEGTVEIQGGRRTLHADIVVREARITLGQLPAELRDKIRTVRIFGPRDLAQQLADETELRLEQMSLKVEVVKAYAPGEFGVQLPSDAAISPAFSFAVRYLANSESVIEFLPPKVPAWKQFADKYGSGKTRKGVAAAAAVVGVVLLLFLYQEVQLIRWRAHWKQMSAEVTELKATTAKIEQYRAWSDDSIRGLTILKAITSAFPEDGAVTAKTLEIRDLNTVICSGNARSRQAVVATQQQLSKTAGIAGVKVTQMRGNPPAVQFTMDIQCSGGISAN